MVIGTLIEIIIFTIYWVKKVAKEDTVCILSFMFKITKVGQNI